MATMRAAVYGLVAGLVIAGVYSAAVNSRPWTSTAELRVVQPQVPERFVPAQTTLHLGNVAPAIHQSIASRGTLTNIIHAYNLYRRERERMPLEDVVGRMRNAIRIVPASADDITVSFSYQDRIMAQKVTADLVSRFIQEHTRARKLQTDLTLQLMKDAAERAAGEWESKISELRTARAAGKPLDRLELYTAIARRRYEELSAKVAEAAMLKMLEQRGQGPGLEMVSPATLPADNRPPVLLTSLAGGVIGALAGWLLSFFVAFRVRRAAVNPL